MPNSRLVINRRFTLSILGISLLFSPNVASAYQALNPSASALVVVTSGLGQYGGYTNPTHRQSYRCLTCGMRFSHSVARCPICTATIRNKRNTDKGREEKPAKRETRNAKKQVDSSSSASDSSKTKRLIVAVVTALIMGGGSYFFSKNKNKRKPHLTGDPGTPTDPQGAFANAPDENDFAFDGIVADEPFDTPNAISPTIQPAVTTQLAPPVASPSANTNGPPPRARPAPSARRPMPPAAEQPGADGPNASQTPRPPPRS